MSIKYDSGLEIFNYLVQFSSNVMPIGEIGFPKIKERRLKSAFLDY